MDASGAGPPHPTAVRTACGSPPPIAGLPCADRSRSPRIRGSCINLDGAQATAKRITDEGRTAIALADSLYVRYCAQDTLSRVVPRAVELLGDLDSMASDEVGYLATCANGLDLHPPARQRMTGPLAAYLADGPLTIA
ncbi:hypothetical protein [Streptomyces sp. Rer75]|uniref:hypothetical protein n=1 Tax=Streptomyces sp. Rer75 TaxID=2750011 RepID=UPI0035A0658D